MTDLSPYFSSQAKYKVLEVLSRQVGPIPLRHVAHLTRLPVHSIELALKALVKDRIVRQRRNARYSLFEMNQARSESKTVQALFQFLSDRALEERASSYGKKAVAALRFVIESTDLLRKARPV